MLAFWQQVHVSLHLLDAGTADVAEYMCRVLYTSDVADHLLHVLFVGQLIHVFLYLGLQHLLYANVGYTNWDCNWDCSNNQYKEAYEYVLLVRVFYLRLPKGIRPSALIFHEWNKNCIVPYSFSSSSIEYNSNEK